MQMILFAVIFSFVFFAIGFLMVTYFVRAKIKKQTKRYLATLKRAQDRLKK